LQRERLAAVIEAKRRSWTAYTDIFVNVVDAFQGREADFAIFSVTRSDSRGLGFLREMERINVALSRGRNYLAIIGDHVFCQEAEERKNPLRNVLDYIRANPNDCFMKEVEP
jgi:superfamily I DNA and/or RNA helicase